MHISKIFRTFAGGMFNKYYIGLFFLACSLVACSPSIREAQDVVAQADSLWHAGQMYGVDAGDSATLAQAYETLNVIPFPFREGLGLGFSYAHACYHYGKLLRAKDNPVEAMQAFINATHSRTRDYHILGRVYSNMGDICHIAGDFPLSYNMFEKSAESFLYNNDTISYYYALNDMAFELAMLSEKDSAFAILDKIENECPYSEVLTKAMETRSEACLRKHEYDSALFYATEACGNDSNSTLAHLIQAQIYSHMGVKDSAVCQAKRVLELSSNPADKHNALYILTNDDESKDKASIKETASLRADNQKLMEIQHGAFTQASLLLEQDINRKPNLTWLYAIIATIICVGGVFYWRYRIRKQQMNTHLEQLVERQTDALIQSIKQHIDINNLKDTLHWRNYKTMKADADLYMGGIVSKLESKNLNETEIRFCILTMLDFSQSQIAETIHYGYPSGIKTLKKRISVKLDTTPQQLRDILFHMASIT